MAKKWNNDNDDDDDNGYTIYVNGQELLLFAKVPKKCLKFTVKYKMSYKKKSEWKTNMQKTQKQFS